MHGMLPPLHPPAARCCRPADQEPAGPVLSAVQPAAAVSGPALPQACAHEQRDGGAVQVGEAGFEI